MTAQDRWPELCERVAKDDSLPVRPCGPWTENKLWFWNRYVELTTNAMVGKQRWPGGLAYVDLFCGPGICQIRETSKRVPGSPLVAALAPKPFSTMVLVDKDPRLAQTCRARVQRCQPAGIVSVLEGDCNELIDEVVDQIPERALTLAFVDPTGLDIRFTTLERLARHRRVDFLLYFADAIDLIRNIDRYEKLPVSKLDQMLGAEFDWRREWTSLENRSAENVKRLFSRLFRQQLEERAGYQGFREREIRGPHGPLYSLIYASKHERGLQFWDKVTRRDRSGQRELFDE